MNCDLCNKAISATEVIRVPLREMQQAVRDGFNPFKTPSIDTSSFPGAVFGMSAEQRFAGWRQMLMSDTTDWSLCRPCAEAFRRSTQQAPAPKEKLPTGERDYSALFESALKSAGTSVELAVRNFEEQVAPDPDTADKFFWLGAACMVGASRNPAYLDRAIEFFEEALKIDPKHKNAYAKLFGAYMSKKDDQGVRRTAMRWAKVDPDLPQTARQWLADQEAVTAIPGTAEEAVSKGRELYMADKFDEAVELLEKASDVYKNHTGIAELLSTVLSDRGAARFSKLDQPESAFKDFLRATEVNPQNWMAFVNVCSLAKERGDFELALRSGNKALALHPELHSHTQFMQLLSTIKEVMRNTETT
jgi:tetratricopeptide (TPR) repeat protein